ncbi:hypothetical protein ACF0H5_019736 [Mactra antiquata]
MFMRILFVFLCLWMVTSAQWFNFDTDSDDHAWLGALMGSRRGLFHRPRVISPSRGIFNRHRVISPTRGIFDRRRVVSPRFVHHDRSSGWGNSLAFLGLDNDWSD